MKELPICKICKKEAARVLLDGKFVCFKCFNTNMPLISEINEDKIIKEAARIIGERNADKQMS